jgi:hypothetical protein
MFEPDEWLGARQHIEALCVILFCREDMLPIRTAVYDLLHLFTIPQMRALDRSIISSRDRKRHV